MAFGIRRHELEAWKEKVKRGEIAFLTHYWYDERFPDCTTVTKVGCADVEKLAAWGRQYGLKEEWIDRRGEFPHFDLLGETQRRVLRQEGRLFELERFTKRGEKEMIDLTAAKEMAKHTLIDTLGIELVELGEGRVVATMPVDQRTHQPAGLLHGGASVALAETVASIGAYALVDPQTENVVGLEINANHVRAVRSGTVTATGTVLHRGRTTMVWDIRITDEQGQLVCVSRCTIAIIRKS